MLRRLRRAFTLVEMLVVIAIIAILAAILFPALRGVRAKGMEADCGNNLRQLGVAMYQFASTYGGMFPPPTAASYDGRQDNLLGSLNEFVSTNSPTWFCRRYVAYEAVSPETQMAKSTIGYFYWAYTTTATNGLDMNARTSFWQSAGNTAPSNAPLVLMSDRFTVSPTIQYHHGADYVAALSEKGSHVLVSGGAVRKVAPR
jgi:prepilin-type N-terminal cleavage/methylation domain-containing protein